MLKRTAPILLCWTIASCTAMKVSPPPVVGDPSTQRPRWSCFTASDAQRRKQQVERSALPRVAFTNETAPETLQARMASHHAPALSVAVIRNGEVDWTAAWGSLAIDGAPAGCDSLFQGGSLAKPATVMAALRMQQQGIVDLDAPIDTLLTSWHLPAGKQTSANPVTLRHLFAHTSGATPGGYEGYVQGAPLPTDVQTANGEAPSNARKIEVLDAPGASLRYSGGGYTVAEIALQDRLHQPFEQIMRTWLIEPVGMKQADFTQPLPASAHDHTARGHASDGSAIAGGWHHHPEQAAAGLWTTASDLAALLIEMRRGLQGRSKVFAQESMREVLANPIEGHSYGFRRMGEGEALFITHYGGTVGYRAGMTMNLATGDGAVYLSNADGGQELGPEFFSAVAGVYGWTSFRQEFVERTTQPVAVLQSLAGRYAFDDGPTIGVVYENNALTLVFPNGDRYAMTPIVGAPREFIHTETAVRASFDGEDANTTILLYGDTGRRVAGGE